MAESRASILARFREKVAAGLPIVGGGAGTGISAKCEEAAGIDLIVVYNSGRYRMAGRGSLAGLMPYGNANQVVKELAPEVLTAVRAHAGAGRGVRHRPVPDPRPVPPRAEGARVRRRPELPDRRADRRPFRANLEETGMSFQLEIDCIAAAHDLDLLTTPYAFDPTQARLLTEAGADIIVAHMGLTTSGTIGAKTAKTLDDCVRAVGEIAAAAKEVRGDVIVLCHGGPIAMPEDAQYVLDRCAIEGFYGASSMERLPTETGDHRPGRRVHGMRLARGAAGRRALRGANDPDRTRTCSFAALCSARSLLAGAPGADRGGGEVGRPEAAGHGGLELWLDAARANGDKLVPHDGKLDVWPDASGKGRHLRQPAADARPTRLPGRRRRRSSGSTASTTTCGR